MIIITTLYKGKTFENKYEGDINIVIDDIFLKINWFIDEMPPQDPNELFTWRSNGFDYFYKEEILSIKGE